MRWEKDLNFKMQKENKDKEKEIRPKYSATDHRRFLVTGG